MSTTENDKEPVARVTRTRAQKMASPEKATAESQSATPGKKESFQWSTPADEFADDVGSDIEDIGDDIYSDVNDSVSDSNASKCRTEVDKETGGIIISLGSDEANKYSVSSDEAKNGVSPQKRHKKAKSKQQYHGQKLLQKKGQQQLQS